MSGAPAGSIETQGLAPAIGEALFRRRYALAGIAFVIYVAVTRRLPTQNVDVFLWLVVGLAVTSVRRPRELAVLVADWLPLLGLLLVYSLVRGAVSTPGAAAHYGLQVGFDKALGGGVTPTEWLQDQLGAAGGPYWFDYAAWACYVSYFIVPWAILAALWRSDRERFRRLRARVVGLVVATCTIYALYPAQPPWMAGDFGHISEVDRTIGPMWSRVGLSPAQPVFETGGDVVNLVAAVPSLHAAMPFLLFVFFWPSGRAVRWLLGTWSVAMALTLVYGGEHFVFDIVAGWGLALLVAKAKLPRFLHREVADDQREGDHRGVALEDASQR